MSGSGGGDKIFELLKEKFVTLYQVEELLMLTLYALVILLQGGEIFPELQVFPA